MVAPNEQNDNDKNKEVPPEIIEEARLFAQLAADYRQDAYTIMGRGCHCVRCNTKAMVATLMGVVCAAAIDELLKRNDVLTQLVKFTGDLAEKEAAKIQKKRENNK